METWQVILLSVVVGTAITLIGFIVKAAMWAGSVNSDRDTFKEFMREIRGDIKNILIRLPDSTGVDSPGSPRVLTDFGHSIAKEIRATKWAERLCHSGQLQREVEGMTNYQVQEFCFHFVQNRFEPNDQELRTLEDCAYDNGIEVEKVRRFLAIVLRDRLLDLTPT